MAGEIPGLGARTDKPQPVPNPSLAGLQLKPEDWFLLSRIDGKVDIHNLFLLSVKNEAETIESLKRLLDAKLITLPAATAPATPQAVGQGGAASAASAFSSWAFIFPAGWPTSFQDFVFDPVALAEDVPLDEALKRQLLYLHDQMKKINHYQLFSVSQGATAREIKSKYLRLSKMFHPDRFFRQSLGSWRARLEEVFRWLNEAYQTLSNEETRRAYDGTLQKKPAPKTEQRPEPKGEGRQAFNAAPSTAARAPDVLQALLLKGKRLEREGLLSQALAHYEAALQRRRTAEVLVLVAECLIRMRERLDQAEGYMREALDAEPKQARYWVALAYIVELQDRRSEAIAHYNRALGLDPTHQGARERLLRLTTGGGS